MNTLSAVAAVVALVALPTGLAVAMDGTPPFAPIVAIGGETRLIYPNFPVELLVTEAESGRQFGMVVAYTRPMMGPGPESLIEPKLTETYYVLEGQHRFFVGKETYEGGPGTIVVNPPGVPHGFNYIGKEIGKVLIFYTPSDAARTGADFFVQWAAMNERTPKWIADTNRTYGIDRPAR